MSAVLTYSRLPFLLLVTTLVNATWGYGDEPRKMAFIVGVSKYQKDGLPDLQYAAKDASDLSSELTKHGFKVATLTGSDATKKALDQKLAQFFQACSELGKEDIVLLSFSGHGVQREITIGTGNEAAKVETPFFCVYDTLISDTKTMLDLNVLLQQVEARSATSNNLILVDACRNNSTKGAKAVSLDGSTVKQLPTKISMLFSSSPGMRSFESSKVQQGIFTHLLLRGLRGEAKNHRDEVDWLRLAAHVVAEVPREVPELLDDSVAEQRPNLVSSSTASPVLAKLKNDKLAGPTTSPRPDKEKLSPDKASREKIVEGKSAGEVREANSLGMRMVWIPKGSFTMGSPESEAGHQEDETQVNVKLTQGFWLGETEVTQGEWTKLMGSSPWKGKGNVKDGLNYAATYVSAEDADAFVKKLNEQESRLGILPAGWKYSLPTEAQWEYACRAGEPTAYHFGDDAGELGQYAWFVDNNASSVGEKYAHEVRQKKPNGWGLYDMHGNVWEWCRDSYAGKLPGGSDPFVSDGSSRVHRGGGWNNVASNCRSAYRYYDTPDYRDYDLGFRVALGR